jgi:hypothetical protein
MDSDDEWLLLGPGWQMEQGFRPVRPAIRRIAQPALRSQPFTYQVRVAELEKKKKKKKKKKKRAPW